MATTYSHDSHNLTTFGTNHAAMALAANAVIQAVGGIAVVHNGTVTALLQVPIGGLIRMSSADASEREPFRSSTLSG